VIEIEFAKYHGIGNDFVIIERGDDVPELSATQIEALCDRHTGVGADGLLIVLPGETADFRMAYHNADGGEAEMCGNGIRCFAKYLHDYRLTTKTALDIETGAGVKHVELLTEEGVAVAAAVDMGEPGFAPAGIPVRAGEDDAVNVPLPTSRGEVFATCVSMGNPHCVLFGPDTASAPVAELGYELEHSQVFPEGVNVEFVQVIDPGRIKVRVWERGVGETMACGTGACAAAVASARLGLTARVVEVELPGGVLSIDWTERGAVMMTGPATQVFSGTYFLKP
jgi:diaminopimelate epimerase